MTPAQCPPVFLSQDGSISCESTLRLCDEAIGRRRSTGRRLPLGGLHSVASHTVVQRRSRNGLVGRTATDDRDAGRDICGG